MRERVRGRMCVPVCGWVGYVSVCMCVSVCVRGRVFVYMYMCVRGVHVCLSGEWICACILDDYVGGQVHVHPCAYVFVLARACVIYDTSMFVLK